MPPYCGMAHGRGCRPGDTRVHSTAPLGTTNGETSAMGAANGLGCIEVAPATPFPGPVGAVQQRDMGNEDVEEMENMKMCPISVQFRFFNFQSQACSSTVFPCLQRANFSSCEGNRWCSSSTRESANKLTCKLPRCTACTLPVLPHAASKGQHKFKSTSSPAEVL